MGKRFILICVFLSSLCFFSFVSNPQKKGTTTSESGGKVVHKIKTVVIDAGHGGKDPGCHGLHYKEKNVALAIALRLGHYISENCPHVKVIYTRKTDVFIPLNERAEIANKNKADLFICIHCNASPDKKAYGSATYVMGLNKTKGNLAVAKRENSSILLENNYKKNYDGFDPNSAEANIIFNLYQNAYLQQSLDIAAKIQNQYKNYADRKNNGVKQAGFLVLWRTDMPSFLTETGFLTNPKEEKFLGSKKGQNKIAYCIYRAFVGYKDEMEDTKVKPAKIESVKSELIAKDNSKTDTDKKVAVKDDTKKDKKDKTDKNTNKKENRKSKKDHKTKNTKSQQVATSKKDSVKTEKPAPEKGKTDTHKSSVAKSVPDTTSHHKTVNATDTIQKKQVIAKKPSKSVSDTSNSYPQNGLKNAIKDLKIDTARLVASKNPLPPVKTSKSDSKKDTVSVKTITKKDILTTKKDKSKTHHAIQDSTVCFRVQIVSSGVKIPLSSSKFKGLKDVYEYKSGKIYKYTAGKYKEVDPAAKLQNNLRKQGFKGAFVVAFKNGKRIPVNDAIKLLKR